MIKIVYINDVRRPERDKQFQMFIEIQEYSELITFCNDSDVDSISKLKADGVICHSGMVGYNVVKHFAKQYCWSLLSYSGSVDSSPMLIENPFTQNHYTVHSDYFEKVLPEFISKCQGLKYEK